MGNSNQKQTATLYLPVVRQEHIDMLAGEFKNCLFNPVAKCGEDGYMQVTKMDGWEKDSSELLAEIQAYLMELNVYCRVLQGFGFWS